MVGASCQRALFADEEVAFLGGKTFKTQDGSELGLELHEQWGVKVSVHEFDFEGKKFSERSAVVVKEVDGFEVDVLGEEFDRLPDHAFRVGLGCEGEIE